MERRWKILSADENKIAELQQALKISYSLCKILVQREIDTYDKAKDFFRPQLYQVHDPFLMKDMDKAVNCVLSAMKHRHKILVFGDYDVDGTTSVASMYRFLKKIYTEENIAFYVPHRYREGYGVSKMGIDFAKGNNFKLIISLDCGIKSVDLISYARSLDLDFIVCDHHLPDEEIPPAIAISSTDIISPPSAPIIAAPSTFSVSASTGFHYANILHFNQRCFPAFLCKLF